ncbi:MRC1-like protein, partial [Mya arenaria]
GRSRFGSSMYLPFFAGRNWQDAQNTCELMGGHLVTITTQEENNFVLGIRVYPLSDTWVGANDLSIEGNFTWITGEEWTYNKFTNADAWADSHDENDCLLIKRDQFQDPLFSNKFDDARCSRLAKFVCEWSLRVRTQFGSSMYWPFFAERNWQDAQSTCELIGGHLVTITTHEEYKFVLSLRLDPLSDTWVGANDLSIEGNFTWVTGEEWTYNMFTNADAWGGPPDKNECLLIKRDQFQYPLFSNKFDDAKCDRMLMFVCETPI